MALLVEMADLVNLVTSVSPVTLAALVNPVLKEKTETLASPDLLAEMENQAGLVQLVTPVLPEVPENPVVPAPTDNLDLLDLLVTLFRDRKETVAKLDPREIKVQMEKIKLKRSLKSTIPRLMMRWSRSSTVLFRVKRLPLA